MTKVHVDRETINDDAVVVTKIYKSTGDVVDAGTVVLEYETSKTTMESIAPNSGVLSLAVVEGAEIPIGALLYELSSHPARTTNATSPSTPGAIEGAHSEDDETRPEFSRKAAALASTLRVDYGGLPRQWITSADMRRIASTSAQRSDRNEGVVSLSEAARVQEATAGEERTYDAMSTSIRKRTEIRSLLQGNGHGATSMIGTRISVLGRRLVQPPVLFEEGISDLLIFELARLLRKYPELNGFYIDDKRNGLYRDINVGVSFDSGSNLKVLAICRADRKSLADIQTEFMALLDLYESGKQIDGAVLNSATVTISDLSRTGAHLMFPLVSGAQGLVIGITRITDGYGLYGSFDHRVSEGRRVASLMKELGERIGSHFNEGKAHSSQRCYACQKTMAEEVALGHRGLIRIVLPSGRDDVLCRSCFEGV